MFCFYCDAGVNQCFDNLEISRSAVHYFRDTRNLSYSSLTVTMNSHKSYFWFKTVHLKHVIGGSSRPCFDSWSSDSMVPPVSE